MKSIPTRKRILRWALGLAMGLLAMSVPGLWVAQAEVSEPSATFNVTNTADSGPGSLREAIDAANASPGADLIEITASGTVQLLSPLPVISDPLTIQGPGAGLFAVDGSGSFRVLDTGAVEVTLADLAVQNGNATGSETGAGIRSQGNLTLVRVEVAGNTAESHGGGLYASGSLSLTEGSFRDNTSTNGIGGGMRSEGGTTIAGTHFTGNVSRGDGGGAFVLGELAVTDALFQINRCTATSCDGGGLFSFSQSTITDTQFLSNIAQDQGGGAAAPGILSISGGLFQENQAVFGTGGGLLAQNLATLEGTHFLGNAARSSGGGMYILGTASLTGVQFENNSSEIGTGGGVYASGDLALEGTSFIRNTARQGGGFHHSLGDGSLVNSLFAKNSATDALGAAMLLAPVGTFEVLHATVAGPATPDGTAIEATAGDVTVTNTILASHAVGINSSGAIVQQDFNLFFGNGLDIQGGVSGGASSLMGDPAFLDPDGDDYHLEIGSAAIDAGTDAGASADFDGDSRPLGTGFDIGFDEAQPSPDPPPGNLVSYLPLVIRLP